MNGNLIGVFGSNPSIKTDFLSSIGKKSETEGITIYQRNETGRKFSFLDDSAFPDKIQGYARIGAISDLAYYVFPADGKLTPPDGELAILLDSFGLTGEIQVIDGSAEMASNLVSSSFKGLSLSKYQVCARSAKSSVIDLSKIVQRTDYPKDHALVYVDRCFNVKGVGLVALGFVLTGTVSVHDKLRIIPGDIGKLAEVKGIQISDEDYDSTERGIRVGLSLKGVELKDMDKVSWMDDGSFRLSSSLEFEFAQSTYYKQPSVDRDLHIEVAGELLTTRVTQGAASNRRIAKLTNSVPSWDGMRVSVIDLNSKALRVIGGGKIQA
ncbi:MAG: hypothetical protein JRN15_10065 [Nitrososphaerota archaeon]|nr:hypothetical protein [Nitrososphaerota archaeon]